MFMYWLSAFLDAFDGMAARAYNQSTKFGAVLDMVSDRCGGLRVLVGRHGLRLQPLTTRVGPARCTTLALMVILAVFYPGYALFFQLIITLDIGSHWIHMFSSLTKGSASHKVRCRGDRTRTRHVPFC